MKRQDIRFDFCISRLFHSLMDIDWNEDKKDDDNDDDNEWKGLFGLFLSLFLFLIYLFISFVVVVDGGGGGGATEGGDGAVGRETYLFSEVNVGNALISTARRENKSEMIDRNRRDL